MEDDHVDRPGVDAQQCVKLTGTNRSIDLITLINQCPFENGQDQLDDAPFAGLVVIARSLHPIPFRTRPLNSSAPMVLRLKTWESRSLPGLPNARFSRSSFTMVLLPAKLLEALRSSVGPERAAPFRRMKSSTRGGAAR